MWLELQSWMFYKLHSSFNVSHYSKTKHHEMQLTQPNMFSANSTLHERKRQFRISQRKNYEHFARGACGCGKLWAPCEGKVGANTVVLVLRNRA